VLLQQLPEAKVHILNPTQINKKGSSANKEGTPKPNTNFCSISTKISGAY
jgi:hypothetical protein